MEDNKRVPANWKLRILNYIIDTLSIVIIFYLSLQLLTVLAKYIPFEFTIDFSFLLLIIFVIYYLTLETLTGKTIGKLFTHTIVVNSDGNRPNIKQVILRTIMRVFTIEVLSFLSHNPLGWHDRISGTKVVVNKK